MASCHRTFLYEGVRRKAIPPPELVHAFKVPSSFPSLESIATHPQHISWVIPLASNLFQGSRTLLYRGSDGPHPSHLTSVRYIFLCYRIMRELCILEGVRMSPPLPLKFSFPLCYSFSTTEVEFLGGAHQSSSGGRTGRLAGLAGF